MAPQTRLQSRLQNMNNTQNNNNGIKISTNTNSWSMWWVVLMVMCMFTVIVWTSIEMSNFYDYRPILDCVDYSKQYLNETWFNNYYSHNITV